MILLFEPFGPNLLAGGQRETESPQVADLKKENQMLKRQLDVLTSTIAEFKDELVGIKIAMNGNTHERSCGTPSALLYRPQWMTVRMS
eukprot:6489619-Amphidinium_carterae.6